MRIIKFISILLLQAIIACGPPTDSEKIALRCDEKNNAHSPNALLASRIPNLDSLKQIVQIKYYKGTESNAPNKENDRVIFSYCIQGKSIVGSLSKGVSQNDILKAKKGNVFEKLSILVNSPYAIAHRYDLKEIYTLARRRYDLFGVGDVAFYDLAKRASSSLIVDTAMAYATSKDAGEKGYLNTFNHITAQAMITSLYSEEVADFIADLHELDNMPELVHGVFTDSQLNDPNKNPVDNYVDLVNNEIGQEIGKKLAEKYRIDQNTVWDEKLLTNYLNDLQEYYGYAFRIAMKPFKKEDEIIQKFTAKLNLVRLEGIGV